ncbi:hypothetical protein F5Y12DRAFT_28389 [Xylaria sp. FL1777]|nr:hypothetical protein F5Y12DRAFT_28389 [Xylaria sp. FL1777]
MTDTSSCPENINSTDCLLRLVLQRLDDHYAEYNWDPLTFGFTAPVGILAALFAAFTIYQAVIAASQGSRKANRRAIGQWSTKTTKGWDWHDLSRISTTQTPILTISNLIEKSSLKALRPDYEDSSQASLNYTLSTNELLAAARITQARQNILRSWLSRIMDRFPQRHKATIQESQTTLSRDPSVASWLGFLDELGLAYSDLQDIPLKKQIADYLPADLLAVPAYGEVGFLVTAAAAAGAYSWKTDTRSGFPTVLSRSLQFEFRQHQTFGTVGAFVKYDYSDGAPRAPTKEQLMTALLHSRGDVEINRFFRRNYRSIYDAAEGSDVDSSDHRLFNALGDSGKFFMDILQLSYPPPNHDRRSCLCKYNNLFSADRRDKHHLTWLFMVNTPLRPPVIFPSRFLKSPDIFTFLALHSRFWASLETKRRFSSVNEKSVLPNLNPGLERWHRRALPTRPKHSDLDRILHFLDKQTGEKSETPEPQNFSAFGLDSNELKNSEDMFIFGVVLEGSIKFLYSIDDFNHWFKTLQQIQQQYFRVLILLQLLQIEKPLATYEDAELICEIYSLRTTTLVLLDVKVGLEEKSFGFSAPPEKQNTSWDQSIQTHIPEDDISARHVATLKILSQLIDEFNEVGLQEIEQNSIICPDTGKPAGELSATEREKSMLMKEMLARHTTPLSRLTCVRPTKFLFWYFYTETKLFLLVLLELLKKCHENISSNKVLMEVEQQLGEYGLENPSPQPQTSSTAADDRGTSMPDEESPRDHNARGENIRDILIWKYILLGMLFSTAPDNSDLLSSGVWEHVVPII